MPDAIALRGVTKTFGDTVAVRGLDLVVPQGALYGVIGPNGAGKTTAIRMILSILLPDRGELSVLGLRSALDAKNRIGYLPEERGLYKRMRVGPFLAYMARLKEVNDTGLDARIRSWLDRVGLGGVEGKRCEELSKGMQQKVQFLAAIIHRPDLLILDEPFAGLDPVNQRLIRELVLEEHRRGATVLFSTHIMAHAEQLCDHVVMIHQGVKVLDDEIGAIRARYDPRSLVFESLDPDADASGLNRIPGVNAVRKDGAAWEISLSPAADRATVIRQVASVVPPARIELRRPTLEDVFIGIVSDAPAGAGGDVLRAAISDRGDAPGGGSR